VTVDKEMQTMQIAGPGAFQFSATRPDDLQEDEYTLAVIVDDVSPSTEGHRDGQCECNKNIVGACKKHPKSEKLILRRVIFGSRIEESHGFKELIDVDPDEYKPEPTIGGSTCLFDATYDGVSAILDYAKLLDDTQDITCNGIVFVITDGMNNTGTFMDPHPVRDRIRKARKMEELESIKVILIGLYDPNDPYKDAVRRHLSEFEVEGELDQYVDVGDATPENLAKLGDFISESISSQSQALGGGQPSQNLTF